MKIPSLIKKIGPYSLAGVLVLAGGAMANDHAIFASSTLPQQQNFDQNLSSPAAKEADATKSTTPEDIVTSPENNQGVILHQNPAPVDDKGTPIEGIHETVNLPKGNTETASVTINGQPISATTGHHDVDNQNGHTSVDIQNGSDQHSHSTEEQNQSSVSMTTTSTSTNNGSHVTSSFSSSGNNTPSVDITIDHQGSGSVQDSGFSSSFQSSHSSTHIFSSSN